MTIETIQNISIATAVVSAAGAAISAIYSAKISKITLTLYRKEKREKLHEELNRILEIGIEYPYLESAQFTSKWLEYRESNDEKYLRYDMYSNLMFNYLHHVCEHFNYDKSLIHDFVDIKTWVRLHKLVWLHPVDENDNIDGYDEKFRNIINSYLK